MRSRLARSALDAVPRRDVSTRRGVARRVTIHATAEVSPDAIIGDGTRIWNEAQVREGGTCSACGRSHRLGSSNR
jgi:carbonic anhydrase/acetyltransferase-like protein (isoleucine patch superfamily)